MQLLEEESDDAEDESRSYLATVSQQGWFDRSVGATDKAGMWALSFPGKKSVITGQHWEASEYKSGEPGATAKPECVMPGAICDENDAGETSGGVLDPGRDFLIASTEVLGLEEFMIDDVLLEDIY